MINGPKTPSLRNSAIAASFFLLLAAIFPPWVLTYQEPGISQVRRPLGIRFLLSPPNGYPQLRYEGAGIRVDFAQLILEWVIILGFFTFICLSLPAVARIIESIRHTWRGRTREPSDAARSSRTQRYAWLILSIGAIGLAAVTIAATKDRPEVETSPDYVSVTPGKQFFTPSPPRTDERLEKLRQLLADDSTRRAMSSAERTIRNEQPTQRPNGARPDEALLPPSNTKYTAQATLYYHDTDNPLRRQTDYPLEYRGTASIRVNDGEITIDLIMKLERGGTREVHWVGGLVDDEFNMTSQDGTDQIVGRLSGNELRATWIQKVKSGRFEGEIWAEK